ncbi:thioredoxin domain-containing protein 17 isoform X1 [Balaenoptera ricei]|uniref:thioredoxin domain-containing protein 17 isoform X1 n=1 Tax=Balaenoptera ricei TaxID=2746895 RepID=UPI0028BD6678|nr:thioredoxin domain-containing protein 17 isoform X1 [Balaenoptera ricei]
MGLGPGPDRGRSRGFGVQRALRDLRREQNDGAEEFWPSEAPVALQSQAGYLKPCPAPRPPGNSFAPPRMELLPAAAEPKTPLAFRGTLSDGPLRRAEPVVREGLKHVGEGCVFIYCQVGEKPYWKDPNNDFRKKLKLTAVPTLLKYGTPQKLVESECLQANLVEMLFSED